MAHNKMHICFSTILGNTNNENETKNQITAYNNFFSGLYSSSIPISIHFTGSFLQLLQTKSQAFDNIAKILLKKKQIELIGGGYFSPVFPFLNSVNIVGQIELYTATLRKLFSIRTKIAYLPFSAWIPSLVSSLKKTATIEHCLIDRRLFQANNLEVHTPVYLEDAGKLIHAIPFLEKNEITESPEEFYNYLVSEYAQLKEDSILVIFVPHTNLSKLPQTEQDGSWFDKLVHLINKNENMHMSTILKSIKSINSKTRGFIESNVIQNNQLQNASTKRLICQNPYAYKLYQKLMYTSLLINQIRGDKQKKTTALHYLWKAQNADIFLNVAFAPARHRSSIFEFYKTLLLAEKTTRTSSTFFPSLVPYDFSLQGINDYISQTKNINAYVHVPSGVIFEYDFLPANKNYCVSPFSESGLFIDRVLYNEAELSNLYHDETDYKNKQVQYQLSECFSTKKILILKSDSPEKDISVRKQFSFNGDSISVQYILKNEVQKTTSGCFVCELDIAVGKSGNQIPCLTVFTNSEKRERPIENTVYTELDWVQINDAEGKTKLTITMNEKINLSVVPVLSNEHNIIAVQLYFYWNFSLNPKGEVEKLLTMVAERSISKR